MTALDRAIEIAGGVAGLAARLHVRPQNVNNWRKRGVPPKQCRRVAAAVGHAITPHDLLPDVFPPDEKGIANRDGLMGWGEGAGPAEATGGDRADLGELDPDRDRVEPMFDESGGD